MTTKQILTYLREVTESKHSTAGEWGPLLVLVSAEDSAADSGLRHEDDNYPAYVLTSLRDLLNCSDYRHLAPWFAIHGFRA